MPVEWNKKNIFKNIKISNIFTDFQKNIDRIKRKTQLKKDTEVQAGLLNILVGLE